MGEYVLAHDLGTSGNKATLFSTEGVLYKSCTYAYGLYRDNPVWAEQSGEEWWQAVCNSTKEILKSCKIKSDEVKAVSFSGQMMGCLPVDREGRPLRRAIIWADQRAGRQAHSLREKIEEDRFYRINGHRNTASYGIQKAMWIKEEEPEIYRNTYKFLNAKDYMVFRLTGKFYTDCSDANSMDCFELSSRRWSEEIVEASGIDIEKLPEIVESVFYVGNVTEKAAKETGLSVSTKVIMGAGDGVAANVGAGCVTPSRFYCCIGTSAWVAGTSETPVLDEKRRTVCWAHAVPGLYSPNGTMQYAGGSYKWLKDTVCREEINLAQIQKCSPYEIINERIGRCKAGADGLLFLPYLLGERAPRWNPYAKGVFFGITPSTTREQILRSVMEGIFMNLGKCLEILTGGNTPDEMLLIGGAARSSQWQQCAADVFRTEVCVPSFLEEANSMGAAVIAGVGSGIYKDFSAIEKFIKIKEKRMPDSDSEKIYRDLGEKYEKLYQALISVFHEER